ncbi:MAG TPA: histidinol dehydrogenase [Nitrospirae bacterium]|nr:histidinol dehydrogenase [Nitrospirota bacterium]
MRVIDDGEELERFMATLRGRAGGVSEEIVRAVAAIVSDVRARGDRALREYTERFDGLKAEGLRMTPAETRAAAAKASAAGVEALRAAAGRIRAFHQRQREESWSYREGGVLLGQIIRPIQRVGVYVPGGKASYPSTVLMNVIPAQVAGVEEIALCVPTPRGEVNPHVMAAVRLLGVKEVYRVGGAQAVAAMAYGTETIKKVDKIVGPGNIYVATAKRMVFGEVDIDMIAGPSEVLIIADSTAPPEFVAADLLSQAEHDELASSVLVTSSRRLALRVKEEVERQLESLGRKDIARASIENFGAIILTGSLRRAVRIADLIAPEHLEIMTEKPEKLLPHVRNAGAVFLGRWTPESMGDYAAGPNHTLPTGGTARFFSPLGVYDFVKRSSLLSFSRRSFQGLSPVVETLAELEGLEAHGRAVAVRRGGK